MPTQNNETLRETAMPSRRNFAPKFHPQEPVGISRENHLITHGIFRIHAMQFDHRPDTALP
jgi:hypothetical protein